MTTTSTWTPVRTRNGGDVHLAISATSASTVCGSKVSGRMAADTEATCERCQRTAAKRAARLAA